MTNQGVKGSRIKAKIGKENFQIITCICPFDCPQICQPHSPFSVPTRLPALRACCWGCAGLRHPDSVVPCHSSRSLLWEVWESLMTRLGNSFLPKGEGGENLPPSTPRFEKYLAVSNNFPLFLCGCEWLCYQQQSPNRDPSRCERLWAVSALSLAEMKGLERWRLLQCVSAPRRAGAPDSQLLSLLRAIPKVLSSAVCSSQLQADAPEQQGEEGLHHTGRLRALCSQPARCTTAAEFPPAFLKCATRLPGCCAQRRSEKSEVETYHNLLALRVLAAFSVIHGNSLWRESRLIYTEVRAMCRIPSVLLLEILKANSWVRQQKDGYVISLGFHVILFQNWLWNGGRNSLFCLSSVLCIELV